MTIDTLNRMLAEAWRDLAGWHVGMVDEDGNAVFHVGDEGALSCYGTEVFEINRLPDIDSPANWGHWLAWTKSRLAVLPPWLHKRWDSKLAWRLLAWVHQTESLIGCLPLEPPLPPSVLAWWDAVRDAEQEASK